MSLEGFGYRCGSGLRSHAGMRSAQARWLSVLAWMLLWAMALDAHAMREITAGKAPKLAADEGLVVFAVDTDTRVSNVQIGRADGGTAEVLNYFDVGRSMRLYAAKAGDYEWSKVVLTTVDSRYVFDIAKPEFRFSVQAGKIVYPGELVMRPSSLMRSYIQVHNRGLTAMDWLEATHPSVYASLEFQYAGYYPDSFPDVYRAARARSSLEPDRLSLARPVQRPMALTEAAEEMWQPDSLLDVALSPSGGLLAVSQQGMGDACSLELLDVRGEGRRCVSRQTPVELVWKDEQTLIGRFGNGAYTAYLLSDAENGRLEVQTVKIASRGRLVDPLPAHPGHILFEGNDSRGALMVHRLALSAARGAEVFAGVKVRDRLNIGIANDAAWYTDAAGNLRAALVYMDQEAVLFHGRDNTYRKVLNYRDGVMPLALSADGEQVYAISDVGRAQRDLVVFDPASRQVTSTLFSKPGVDVVDLVLDNTHKPVAARYYLSGRLFTEYFAEPDRAVLAWLQASFPGRDATVIDRSDDGGSLVVWVESSDRPAQIHLVDAAQKRMRMVAEVNPALAKKTYAPARVIEARSSDGLSVEAFLTLPQGEGKRPLVVFPHGGPIGVSDRLHFDREVQYLATHGFAVLQVNFRGSDGRGRALREAGQRNYGRGIEDDIDAALRETIARHPVDESRVCVLGASYGGYSALISAIRWPGRFRCAVSIAGISDLALFFTASDGAHSEKRRGVLEQLIGDPRSESARMQEVSPLYRAGELTLPVMLVHGREDKRVDFEHTRRLVRMLNLEGRPPVVLAPANMGHGPDRAFDSIVIWSATVDFLQRHLAAAAAEGATGAAPKKSGFTLP